MDALQRNIVLVTRRTRLDDLIARFNTIEQARFYVEHLGADFADYEIEHQIYREAITTAEATLMRFGRVQRLDRGLLPTFLFAPDALVVVLGQDGLVANTLKYLDGQRVIGVNPDSQRWDGALLPFTVGDLHVIAAETFAGIRSTRSVTMARARLSDGQQLLAVNDLFIGPKSHVSARYRIQLGDVAETQSSSGIIVSTGLGSTRWFRSLVTGAVGIVGGEIQPEVAALRNIGFPWDAHHLYFTVREPFPSRTTQTELVFGKIAGGAPLRLVSQMANHGVIFSDGIEKDFLEFNAGMEATIDVADRHGCLVM